MQRPVIGVTASSERRDKTYADAVERNGGASWLILPDHKLPPEETLARIDGLFVPGGEDVGPGWYGKDLDPDAHVKSNPDRDAVELPLLRAALDRDMPVLCVCRGMQALNVVMGGTLVQHMDGHGSVMEDGRERSSFHRIYISPGSKLAAIVGSGGFVRVNSWHHQGVREAQKSPQLLASAYGLEDGVIEGLESPRHDWVIGVQFHPEIRSEVPPHFERLFQGLVQRSGRLAGDTRVGSS